jgi:putative addiction module component (TIGR02574 family)
MNLKILNNRYFVEREITMGAAQIREFLHEYINKADDRFINLMYAMVQADMKEDDYDLSVTHKKILDERIAAHQANQSSGSSWDEVKARIKSQL